MLIALLPAGKWGRLADIHEFAIAKDLAQKQRRCPTAIGLVSDTELQLLAPYTPHIFGPMQLFRFVAHLNYEETRMGA